MFKEEIERLIKMEKFYKDKISALPKGSIIFKKRRNKKYPYLVYRDGSKVVTDYLRLDKNDFKKLQLELSKRKKYLKLLKEIQKDLKSFGNTNNE